MIYLASRSPRRQELLCQIGVDYRLLPVAVDETRHAGESAAVFAQRIALEKAAAGRAAPGTDSRLPVLGADTIVCLEGDVMGKPRDREQALGMLHSLSGRTHQVLSAVALVARNSDVRLSTSRVRFRRLSTQECVAYWETGEPAGKAGAYAIQGIAATFVERLEGSYSGVMGLPLFETAALLQESGISVL
ncbi:MAG: Maf family protein [Gammaproteobacteria bacterium]|jgi:septum formation protein